MSLRSRGPATIPRLLQSLSLQGRQAEGAPLYIRNASSFICGLFLRRSWVSKNEKSLGLEFIPVLFARCGKVGETLTPQPTVSQLFVGRKV